MGKISKALDKASSRLTTDSPPTEAPAVVEGQSKTPGESERYRKSVEHSAPVSRSRPDSQTVNWDERLINSTRNMTGVAEGIRKVRSMLLHESEKRIHKIMVLSSDPQEGKSFICANIGISVAKSVEQQALLMDCDLRRPSLHTLFGIKPETGLAEYLSGKSNRQSLLQSTGMNKLSLIPSGHPPSNPAELLSSEKMSDLLDEVCSQRDDRLVILDTPPFYAASETILLSQLVDKVILVVRWGKSGREQVKKMVETIGHDKIIGTVFNAFEMNFLDKKIQGVGYHNYYSEYY